MAEKSRMEDKQGKKQERKSKYEQMKNKDEEKKGRKEDMGKGEIVKVDQVFSLTFQLIDNEREPPGILN